MVFVNIVNRLNNYGLIVLIEIAKEQLFSLFTISAGTVDHTTQYIHFRGKKQTAKVLKIFFEKNQSPENLYTLNIIN